MTDIRRQQVHVRRDQDLWLAAGAGAATPVVTAASATVSDTAHPEPIRARISDNPVSHSGIQHG
jgi:hypothetical protein